MRLGTNHKDVGKATPEILCPVLIAFTKKKDMIALKAVQRTFARLIPGMGELFNEE